MSIRKSFFPSSNCRHVSEEWEWEFLCGSKACEKISEFFMLSLLESSRVRCETTKLLDSLSQQKKNTNEKTETNLLWKIDQFKQLNVLREYTNVCKIVANQSAYCSLNLFYQAAGSKQMIGMHLSLEQINSPLIDTISSCLLCVLLCAQRCRLTGIKCNQLARCARAITALEHHRVTSANAASRLVHDKQRRRKNLRFGFESSTCAWS